MSRKTLRCDLYANEEDLGSTEDSNDLDEPYTDQSMASSPVSPPTRHARPNAKPPHPSKAYTHHYDSSREHRRHLKQGPPSVDTVESLSTIPSHDVEAQEDVQDVYHELQEINDKLKREFKILHQRDLMLKQKEKSLNDLQLSMETAINNELKRRLQTKEQEYQVEFQKLDDAIREKMKENRRLKENFDSLKTANDILRKELDTLAHSHEKLQKQHQSVQARFINLQRRKEREEKKPDNVSDILTTDLTEKIRLGLVAAKGVSTTKKVKSSNTKDVISSLLDWVCESQLRQAAVDQPTKLVDNITSQELIEDRCFKMLPSMVELLREQASSSSQIVLPCLQFIYWALLHLENSQSQHLKTSLSTTLRRLGEELYRGRSYGAKTIESESEMFSGSPHDKQKIFFKSDHLHTRLLCSLIILKSISQVDHLAQVYELLRNDLKTDSAKEFFLYYQATPIMLTHLKPSNKALTNSALDIYLQMSMDSPYLRSFLDSCSRESWFQAVSLVWKMPGIEGKQHEKLSIILQKLSKIRLNKKYFEVFGLTTSCQELQRSSATLSPFLSLNLKSILFNLSSGSKTQAKSST